MLLKDKVALITGSGRGIGKSIALRFAEEGASVAINYNASKKAAQDLYEKIRSMGKPALAIKANVSSENEVRNMIERVIEEFGKLDILVANAGIERLGLVMDTPVEVWDEVFDVNVKGVFLCCKHAIPHLMKNKGGTIINMASCAGKTGWKYFGAYCASKFAVIGLTQSLTMELAEHNITVNAICPGAVDTDMLYYEYDKLSELKKDTVEDEAKILLNSIPIKRISKPEEIANLAVYLASDNARDITGAAINITGGLEVH
ncbi:MAG: SDR family NAD(P)-dependent oxidoreductase [Candidatus Hodarchaeota archaeon]